MASELGFLRHAALRKVGGGQPFEELYALRRTLMPPSDAAYGNCIELKFSVEFASHLLNRGRAVEAERLFNEVLGSDDALDFVSLMVAVSGSLINAVNLGKNQLAALHLAAQRKYSRQLSVLLSAALPSGAAGGAHADVPITEHAQAQHGYLRMICAEGSRSAAVGPSVSKGRMSRGNSLQAVDVDRRSLNQFAILSQQAIIRAHLRRGALLAARNACRKMEEDLAEMHVAPDIVNLAEESIELALMSKELGSGFFLECQTELDSALKRGDFRSEMRIRSFLGAGLVLSGKPKEAISHLLQAARVGERESLQGDMFEVNFHLAGAFFAAGQNAKGLGYLDRCSQVAELTEAENLKVIVDYIVGCVSEHTLQARKVDALLSNKVPGLASQFLDFYPFMKNVTIQWGEWGRYEATSEFECRKRFRSFSGFLFFEHSCDVLLLDGGNVSRSVTLRLDAEFRPLLRSLLESKSGLTVLQLHRLRMPDSRNFDSARHGAIIRGFVTRVRQEIVGLPMEVLYDTVAQVYRVQSRHRGCVIPAKAIARKIQRSRSDSRREFVLAYAAARPSFTVADLCRELCLTRQALHPLLSDLVRSGELLGVKKGPRSLYRIGKKSSKPDPV
jgi:hypothetical protein